ncbi:MAG: hypothetical protein WD066_16390 [Planctomycetaceae bacterium]
MRAMLLVAASAIPFAAASAGFADDYLVRLEVIGFEDAPETEADRKAPQIRPAAANEPAAEAKPIDGAADPFPKDPRDTVLRGIEVVARPNVPFRARAVFGPRTLTFSGCIESVEDAMVNVRCEIVDRLDAGPVPGTTERGGRTAGASATVGLKLDSPSVIGGSIGSHTIALADGSEKTTVTMIRHRVTLSKHIPAPQAPPLP